MCAMTPVRPAGGDQALHSDRKLSTSCSSQEKQWKHLFNKMHHSFVHFQTAMTSSRTFGSLLPNLYKENNHFYGFVSGISEWWKKEKCEGL